MPPMLLSRSLLPLSWVSFDTSAHLRYATDASIKEMEKEVRIEVDAAVEFAKSGYIYIYIYLY
jgi:hypothetical protein